MTGVLIVYIVYSDHKSEVSCPNFTERPMQADFNTPDAEIDQWVLGWGQAVRLISGDEAPLETRLGRCGAAADLARHTWKMTHAPGRAAYRASSRRRAQGTAGDGRADSATASRTFRRLAMLTAPRPSPGH